jgi:hypothetical protein
MVKPIPSLIVAGLLAATPVLGTAQTLAGPTWRPFLMLGLTGGGDAFDRFIYSDGTTKSVKAGALVQFSAGVDVALTGPFSAQLSVGYHTDHASGSDGKFSFNRMPIEVLAHWRANEQWRFGGGLRWARSAEIDSRGSLGGRNAEFDASTGLVLEGEYFVKPNFSLKLRLVNEKFTDKAAPSREYGGNHAGAFATLYFR